MGIESISQNGSIMNVASPTITTSMVDGKPMANPDMTKRKNRTNFRLLKVAVRLFNPAPRPDEKQAKKMSKQEPEEIAKPAQWEKIVGSMRPLHLQENLQSPTHVSPNESPRKEDGTLSEMSYISSPDISSPSASITSSRRSDIGTMSQYSSAVNLQDLAFSRSRYNSVASLPDLDTPTSATATTSRYCSMNNLQDLLKGDESEVNGKDPDEVFESITADDMIDSKADEFIAKFYHGMSLERSHRKPRRDQWRL